VQLDAMVEWEEVPGFVISSVDYGLLQRDDPHRA
jgi:hypothetical protein